LNSGSLSSGVCLLGFHRPFLEPSFANNIANLMPTGFY
jgi:hypothetical protein